MSPRARAAAAGAFAALVWGLQEPLDQRVFGCDYSDVLFLGRGRRLRRRIDVDGRRLALALALGEHVATWPFISLVDRRLVTSPRAFAQATYRHALFGLVLGRLA